MPENQPLADPAPLGLAGFGLTTVLLNIVNTGMVPADSIGMVLPLGLFFGGLAQFCAGMWEVRRGNTFGATAFGAFWMALATMVYLGHAGVFAVPASGMVAFLVLWAVFTGYMTISTFRLNKALQVIFLTLTLLFILLAIGEGTGNDIVMKVAGAEGIVCGLSALYTSAALVANSVYGKEVLPLGVVK